ncbi:MAG: CotH kinase family protein [Planctomycetota bacterium]
MPPAPRTRATLRIAAALLGFGAFGWTLEQAAWFDPIRRAMRDPTAPSPSLDRGELGQLLRGQGLLLEERPPRHERWRGHERDSRYRANPAGIPVAPSEPLAADYLVPGWPLISLAVDEVHLHDPERGIVVNWKTDWERPAHVSYFEGEELRFSSKCGVRLHGGKSRDPKVQARRGVTWRSFRVYLREEFGATLFPDSLLPGPPSDRVIVRGNSALNCAFAFDISRSMGLQAPDMRPGVFVLNGKRQGMFSLAEHLTKRRWALRLGHDDFLFHRIRGGSDAEDQDAYGELRHWARRLDEGEATLAAVGARVDVDNLTRSIFVTAWTANDDWVQGAAVLERNVDEPRWRWIQWDMDRSFREGQGAPRDEEPWERESLGIIERRAGTAVRGMLFLGLLRDEPAYRESFLTLATELMNHVLVPDRLLPLLEAYRPYVHPLGIAEGAMRGRKEFVLRRNHVVRGQLAEAFELGEPLRCRVEAPASAELVIDGHPAGERYRGFYFAGQTLHARTADGAERTWRVNGDAVVAHELRLTVEEPLQIELL